jgi:hypothetical protein
MKVVGEVTKVEIINGGFMDDRVEVSATITGPRLFSGSHVKLILAEHHGRHYRIRDKLDLDITLRRRATRKRKETAR